MEREPHVPHETEKSVYRADDVESDLGDADYLLDDDGLEDDGGLEADGVDLDED